MKLNDMDEEQKVALLGALFGGLTAVVTVEYVVRSVEGAQDRLEWIRSLGGLIR